MARARFNYGEPYPQRVARHRREYLAKLAAVERMGSFKALEATSRSPELVAELARVKRRFRPWRKEAQLFKRGAEFALGKELEEQYEQNLTPEEREAFAQRYRIHGKQFHWPIYFYGYPRSAHDKVLARLKKKEEDRRARAYARLDKELWPLFLAHMRQKAPAKGKARSKALKNGPARDPRTGRFVGSSLRFNPSFTSAAIRKKLKAAKALREGATTQGERVAAQAAVDRFEARLKAMGKESKKKAEKKKASSVSPGVLAKNLVTRGEWKQYLRAKGLRDESERRGDPDSAPVVGITWYEAEDYAKWKGGRLPTEAELITAEQKYKKFYDRTDWSQWPLDRPRAGVTGVGALVEDLFGVIYQWTSDKRWGGRVVFRGGIWDDPSRLARVKDRGRSFPGARDVYIGVRIVMPKRKALKNGPGPEREVLPRAWRERKVALRKQYRDEYGPNWCEDPQIKARYKRDLSRALRRR